MLVIAAIAAVMIVSTAAIPAFYKPPISADAQATACSSDAQCQPGVETCIKGKCSKANPSGSEPQVCPSGFADCDRKRSNQCEVNLRDSNAHCGACGNECAVEAGQTCQNGACRCPSGQEFCNGQCRSPGSYQTDANNCGSCGNICPTPPNANSAACQGGSCTFTCQPGFESFKGTCLPNCPDETFERDQATGQCKCPSGKFLNSAGNSCVAQCGTNEVEVNGRCAACAAQPGVQACGNACVNTNIDPANCGSCGKACQSGEFCNAGTCAQIISCGSGLQVCNGVCTSTQADPANCGQCGNICGQTSGGLGSTCQSGACECPSGQFLSSDGSQCTAACQEGEFVDSAGKKCVASCQPGEFIDSTGKKCVAACPPGEFVNSAGTQCVAACGDGEVPVDNKCTSCPDNAVPNAGKTACTECPAGQTSNTQGTTCVACPAGEVRAAGEAACHACTAPQVPNAGQTACVPPTPTGCTSSAQCTADTSRPICNTSTGQCVSCGTNTPTTACTNNSQCGAGGFCDAGVCKNTACNAKDSTKPRCQGNQCRAL